MPCAALLAFFVILTFGGGASRADVASQLFVRVVAIITISATFIMWPRDAWRGVREPLMFFAALGAVMLVQLIPLPPKLWTALPGRELYAEAALIVGVAQPWRPISLTPDLTINSLFSLLPPIAALMAVGWLGRARRDWAVAALAVLVVVSGVMAVFQVTEGPSSALRLYRITSTDTGPGLFANRNHNALLLSMGIPLFLWIAHRRLVGIFSPPIRFGLTAGILVFLLVSIMVTGSRAGILLTGVGFCLGGLLLWREGALRRVSRPVLLGGCVMAVVVAGLLATQVGELGRFKQDVVTGDARVLLLPEFVKLGEKFFPVGAGFGAFDSVYRVDESPQFMTDSYINHAHNDIIEIIIEAGVVGGLLLLAALSLYIRAAWRVWRDDSKGAISLGLARLGSILIMMIGLHSFVDYPVRTPVIAAIIAVSAFWLSSGALSARERGA